MYSRFSNFDFRFAAAMLLAALLLAGCAAEKHPEAQRGVNV